MKTKFTSLLMLFGIAAIWGFAFVAQAEGANHLGTFAFNGIRFAIGAVSLLPVALLIERGRATKEQRKRTLVVICSLPRLSSMMLIKILFAFTL